MLNYDFVEEKAGREKIDKVTIEREYYQLLFLQKLYSQKNSEDIYFKGGTAIRFLLQSFRFSEDLDFTGTLSRNTLKKILYDVFSFFIKNSSSSIEVKEEKVWEKFSDVSLKYRLLFLPKDSRQKVSIRIDISLREKPQTREQTVLIPFDYPISPYPLIIHLSNEELMAEKIRALYIRSKPRDLFDFWFLLTKKIPINDRLIKRKLDLYKDSDFSMKKLKKIIENYEEKELKKDLNQFLPEKYRNLYKSLKKEILKFF